MTCRTVGTEKTKEDREVPGEAVAPPGVTPPAKRAWQELERAPAPADFTRRYRQVPRAGLERTRRGCRIGERMLWRRRGEVRAFQGCGWIAASVLRARTVRHSHSTHGDFLAFLDQKSQSRGALGRAQGARSARLPTTFSGEQSLQWPLFRFRKRFTRSRQLPRHRARG